MSSNPHSSATTAASSATTATGAASTTAERPTIELAKDDDGPLVDPPAKTTSGSGGKPPSVPPVATGGFDDESEDSRAGSGGNLGDTHEEQTVSASGIHAVVEEVAQHGGALEVGAAEPAMRLVPAETSPTLRGQAWWIGLAATIAISCTVGLVFVFRSLSGGGMG